MPEHMVDLIRGAGRSVGRELRDSKITIIGPAFLRDSDDVRHPPSLKIIDNLEGQANVVVHDPFVLKAFKALLSQYLDAVIGGADCLVVVTDPSCYRDLDLSKLHENMGAPIIVDGRNVFRAEDCRKHGITYVGVGKPRPRT